MAQHVLAGTTDDSPPPPPPTARGPGWGAALMGPGRRLWRWLTSMRTALILLFLLALAAIPGSLLPQRNVNPEKVTQYFAAHPKLAPQLDRLSVFSVFSSPWFSAIYLLLFVSLVGCLVPRLRAHVIALVRVPPDAPARLERLPAHAAGLALDGDPSSAARRLHALLRKRWFRVRTRGHADGSVTVSAEKGYLKETGNILFHFALLAILTGVAFGSWYGYHADRLVVEGPDQAFCNTLQQFDDYGLGARVDPRDLEPFCLQLNRFSARYADSGQPLAFSASVTYTIGDGAPHHTTIKVNDPLRLSRARVYLIGHGYAPVIRYTDRYGRTQTTVVPFLPQDGLYTSTGVALFPDVNVPPTGLDPNNKQQMAFQGVYVPTSDGTHATSIFPGERNPVLVITPYRGDLGLDAGIPHSVYSLNSDEIDRGRLKPVTSAPLRLKPGQSATLDDGSRVEFVGTRQFATMAVRYDPGEQIVLVGAVCLLLGLVTMLFGRRRRVWFRVRPSGESSTAEAAALARGEYVGFDAEFAAIVEEAGRS
ncbi:MAG TPA: cytochrome c biogenesis protein ResB [Rugosimonospora sp.]|nr:cytochrome c biogenesis protein ResB [Rugosimonospora sp.]